MIKVVTDHPIAYESLDHTEPLGTKQDNTHHKLFVRRTMEIFEGPVSHIDLGCAGGGLVFDFLEYGNFSVGIDGSDYSLKIKRAEWATIPDNLFTADITKPFHVTEDDEVVKFDVITAWEVMEHIHEHDLPPLFENIKNLMADEASIFVCSIADWEDDIHHVTCRPYEWWKKTFEDNGFTVETDYYDIQHMVRKSSFYFTVSNANF
jgi:2-polyprenyl-3-methyl-5-hydroxy-6-metoxy-1,4-benzoquinol methylase